MSIFSKIRRNIILEGNVYKADDLFGNLIKENEKPKIDNPEFYDVETRALKLGNLCSDELKKGVTPSVDMEGATYTTYCALLQLSHNLPQNLVNQYHRDLDIIYNFLRRDLSLDNRRKFHSLIKALLNYDNPANSIGLVAQYIEKTDNNDEIRKTLDMFRVSDVNETDIEEFLKKVKFMGYTEYEDSFLGDHFSKNKTRLILKYKSEEENRGIYQIIKEVMRDGLTISEAVSLLYNGILENYTPDEMVKGDLISNKDIYDDDGNLVILSGDVVEVKKLDYQGDSYLSEFFAIYKYSKIPEDALQPNFIKTYNKLIDGLFVVFSSSGRSILEDIKKNFAGIIYDDKTFISSDDIELYWSNKGRSSCSKDHRLSIRYRINKPNVFGYIYEGSDVIIKKPLNISLATEKFFCPIIKEKQIEESYDLNQISNLLLEGRKEDARKKYPNFSDEVFNYYVDNDPSGNQKYLDWLLRVITPEYKTPFETHTELVNMVDFFHKHQTVFTEKDINRHSFTTLEKEIKEVKEKLLKKKEEKQAKKEKTIIYNDDRWFVVSPDSWKASCYYGAGTKWCITSKNSPQHWEKYSKRASFFFVIDKTKKQDDPLYKVAYRVIGSKGKYELWDAEDLEITRTQRGVEWLESLPDKLKEETISYHEKKHPKKIDGRPDWVDDDQQAQALLNYLNLDDIEDIGSYWYGMPIYEIEGDHWVVGDEGDMKEALKRYYDDYGDDELMEYYDPEGWFLEMDDVDGFINEEVDYQIDDSDDREILEITDYHSDWDDIEFEIDDLRSQIQDLDVEENADELEGEISDLELKQERLIESAKEEYADQIRREWVGCFRSGAVGCLIDEKGFYSTIKELNRSGLVTLDRDGLIDSITSNADYEDITQGNSYHESYDDDNEVWYVFEIDY